MVNFSKVPCQLISDDVALSYFSGFANKDVAWLHTSSKTLVVADLLFNLPGNEQVRPAIPNSNK